MKRSALEKKLLAVARANPPSDRVPYAFEKRVVHYLVFRPLADPGALWAQALWRSAAACLALVLLLGSISVFVPATNSQNLGDLSQDFEKTMLASLD